MGKRVYLNVIVFISAAMLLVFLAARELVLQPSGGRVVVLGFKDVGGLADRNDVTMRGVPVGRVTDVSLSKNGLVRVTVALEPGNEVTQGTHAEIMRRSPIGDLVLNLIPGKGPVLPDNGWIPEKDTQSSPDAERTIQALASVLHAVPSGDIAIVVHQLALALNGRGADLARLSVSTADLPQRILQVQTQLQQLITTGPKVLNVLATNADTLGSDISLTADLAQILRDRRYDLVSLSQNGARFAVAANNLIYGQKANLSCLINDFGTVNGVLAQPQELAWLKATLSLNHYFFDGVEQLVVTGKDGLTWFRVQLVPPQSSSGRAYTPRRPPPDVYAADGCSTRFGKGVGPGSQPGPVWLAQGSKLHPGK
jgi:phospholipid/cholesterol/gamma-HCH transport system substrate-binding protein